MSTFRTEAEFWAKRVVATRNDATMTPEAVEFTRIILDDKVAFWRESDPAEHAAYMSALKKRA